MEKHDNIIDLLTSTIFPIMPPYVNSSNKFEA